MKYNYIDYDDVIQATSEYNWYKDGEKLKFSHDEALKHAVNIDWKKTVTNSLFINDSINILKQLDSNTNFILTKVHSFDEGYYKTKIMRDKGIELTIIPADYRFEKWVIVNPLNHTLIDDSLKNCLGWHQNGGTGIYFSKDNSDTDNWGTINKQFVKVNSLEFLVK